MQVSKKSQNQGKKPPDESRGLNNFGCDRLRYSRCDAEQPIVDIACGGTRSQSAVNAL
ncbi:hypothetical protein [Nostoc sp.]|uniref:hypothetical protein n=1 Tax=Nostoc sp. TaxID=1180 RepID=UPI002FFC0D21